MTDDFVPPRIKNDPAVQAWLKTQSEFKLVDFAEYSRPTSYAASQVRPEKAEVADAIRSVLPDLNAADRKLMDLYLQYTPAQIALHLGISRKSVYNAVKYAKKRALKLYSAPRKAAARPKLKNAPAPVKTVRFVAPGQIKGRVAHLILHDGKATWVDEKGGIFDPETQDLLAELKELAAGFDVLDFE